MRNGVLEGRSPGDPGGRGPGRWGPRLDPRGGEGTRIPGQRPAFSPDSGTSWGAPAQAGVGIQCSDLLDLLPSRVVRIN